MSYDPGYWKRSKGNMQPEESLNQCIERLSALAPRKRLEAFRELKDQTYRRQVIRALPPEIYGDILAESGLENLNRNVRERMESQKPSQAA